MLDFMFNQDTTGKILMIIGLVGLSVFFPASLLVLLVLWFFHTFHGGY